ncbi:cytochrome P450 [Saccharopolyspora sp. NPDC000995]
MCSIRRYADEVPHEDFAWLRRHAPVSWQAEHEIGDWPAGPGFWAVTRYADVVAVLKSAEVYSSWLGATQLRDPDPADMPFIRSMMLNLDTHEHGRLRRLVSRAFTPRRINHFRHEVAERARQLVDEVIERGMCDLPVEVTDHYPLRNLADLLGVPESDGRVLLEWTNRVIGYQDPEHSEVTRDPDGKPINPRSPAMLADMFAFAQDLAAFKRRNPADDVMTALATAELDGCGLADAELEMFFFLLSVAGNDTVRSALPGGMLAFAENPGQLRLLLDDPVLLDSAVEEALRFHPPVLSFRRTATTDTELGGQRIAAGERSWCSTARRISTSSSSPTRTASTSGARQRPRRLRQRPARVPGRAFRTAAAAGVLPRGTVAMRDLRVPRSVEHLLSNFINGIKHLPVAFTSGGG